MFLNVFTLIYVIFFKRQAHIGCYIKVIFMTENGVYK